MRFPYGIADFYKIQEGGYFYVDRTDRIALIENAGKQLLFLRPRRFGKSLWLSTLENYYDLARAEDFERLQESLLPDYTDQEQRQRVVERFYATGDLEPLCDFIEQRYFQVFDNRDLRWSNELVVKTAFLVTLFSDTFYVMDSEPALERRYADLMLRVRPDMRQYALLDHLLEFKTISLKEAGLSSAELAATPREALRTLPVVTEKLREAEHQLTAYRKVLERTYGATLKLRTHAVACIGLERLVW